MGDAVAIGVAFATGEVFDADVDAALDADVAAEVATGLGVDAGIVADAAGATEVAEAVDGFA